MIEYAQISARQVESLFDVSVTAVVADEASYTAPLWPEEATYVTRSVAQRRRDFTAGRHCARRALKLASGHVGAIGVNADRSPVWPQGFVGSITHCGGFCAAVVAPRGEVTNVGLDAEPNIPLEPDLFDLVCHSSELEAFALAPAHSVGTWAKLAFVAKEAFYKCCSSAPNRLTEFRDVLVRITGDRHYSSGSFTVTPWRPQDNRLFHHPTGSWRIGQGLILAGATLGKEASDILI